MNNSSFSAQNPPALETRYGQCVKYVMPKGWHVTEDSQFALTLYAPDNAAMIFVGGHFSYPAHHEYLIGAYVEKAISLWHPPQLEVEKRRPRKTQPIAGFIAADDYDYTSTIDGVPWRGVAKCSMGSSYNMSTLLVTSCASDISQWASYASWLPQVADQVELTNAAVFRVCKTIQEHLLAYSCDPEDEYEHEYR